MAPNLFLSPLDRSQGRPFLDPSVLASLRSSYYTYGFVRSWISYFEIDCSLDKIMILSSFSSVVSFLPLILIVMNLNFDSQSRWDSSLAIDNEG